MSFIKDKIKESIEKQEILDNKRSDLALKYNDEIASRIVNESYIGESYDCYIASMTEQKMILKTSLFSKTLPMVIIIVLLLILAIPLWIIYMEYTSVYLVFGIIFSVFIISFFLPVMYVIIMILGLMPTIVLESFNGYKAAFFAIWILLFESLLIGVFKKSLYDIVFDLDKGNYSILKKSKYISNIHAVVLETHMVSRAKSGRGSRAVRLYHISIVFKDSSSIQIEIDKVYSKVYGDGLRISNFLNIPYWNFVLESEK